MSTPEVRWIVSCEDVSYHAWQAALLWYSATRKCNTEPSFVLHADLEDRDHDPLWGSIPTRAISHVESYRTAVCGQDYPPRNTPGTLLAAAKLWPKQAWFVLFDPDMIFTKNWAPRLRPSADKVEYGPHGARVGVPYVIPGAVARKLALEWLAVLDSATMWTWEAVMWAFVVACRRLGIAYHETQYVGTNYVGTAPVNNPVIHFCYGDWKWNKRSFFLDSALPFQNIPTAYMGTVEGEIFSQLASCRDAILRGDL